MYSYTGIGLEANGYQFSRLDRKKHETLEKLVGVVLMYIAYWCMKMGWVNHAVPFPGKGDHNDIPSYELCASAKL